MAEYMNKLIDVLAKTLSNHAVPKSNSREVIKYLGAEIDKMIKALDTEILSKFVPASPYRDDTLQAIREEDWKLLLAIKNNKSLERVMGMLFNTYIHLLFAQRNAYTEKHILLLFQRACLAKTHNPKFSIDLNTALELVTTAIDTGNGRKPMLKRVDVLPKDFIATFSVFERAMGY